VVNQVVGVHAVLPTGALLSPPWSSWSCSCGWDAGYLVV